MATGHERPSVPTPPPCRCASALDTHALGLRPAGSGQAPGAGAGRRHLRPGPGGRGPQRLAHRPHATMEADLARGGWLDPKLARSALAGRRVWSATDPVDSPHARCSLRRRPTTATSCGGERRYRLRCAGKRGRRTLWRPEGGLSGLTPGPLGTAIASRLEPVLADVASETRTKAPAKRLYGRNQCDRSRPRAVGLASAMAVLAGVCVTVLIPLQAASGAVLPFPLQLPVPSGATVIAGGAMHGGSDRIGAPWTSVTAAAEIWRFMPQLVVA